MNKNIIIVAIVGLAAYLWWKHNQANAAIASTSAPAVTDGTSSVSVIAVTTVPDTTNNATTGSVNANVLQPPSPNVVNEGVYIQDAFEEDGQTVVKKPVYSGLVNSMNVNPLFHVEFTALSTNN